MLLKLLDFYQVHHKTTLFLRLINSAEKLFHVGLQKIAEGDEELAFVYFSRFMKIYYSLVNKSNLRPHHVEQRLGQEKITTEKRIHELHCSLKERYNKEINVQMKQNAGVITTIVVDKNNVHDTNSSMEMSYPGNFNISHSIRTKTESLYFF